MSGSPHRSKKRCSFEYQLVIRLCLFLGSFPAVLVLGRRSHNCTLETLRKVRGGAGFFEGMFCACV